MSIIDEILGQDVVVVYVSKSKRLRNVHST